MNRFRRSTLFLPAMILADTLCLNIAFFLSYYIRFQTTVGVLSDKRFLLFWVFNAAWLLIVLLTKPYREPRVTFNISKMVYNFLLIIAIHAGLIAIFWVYTKGYSFSRVRLSLIYVITATLGIGLRIAGVYLLRYLRLKGYNLRTYMLIGKGELSDDIITYYTNHPEMGYVFKGYFEENNLNQSEDFNKQLTFLLQKEQIDYLYCCLPYLPNDTVSKIIEIAETQSTHIKLLMDFRGFVSRGVSFEYHDYLPIINVAPQPYFDKKAMLVKRSFDLLFSSLLMLAGAPIFILVAIITKLTSKGPVFYKSERVGMWGHKFQMYKFRSMFTNADEIADKLLGGDKHSIGNHDPRITPWGRIMRKTRLDELPQFINVLKGEMSVVGPRPLPQYDVDMLIEAAPNQFRRILSVKPGVTSIGQLHFGYASTKQENVHRLSYDVLYLKKYSLRRDVWLVFLTAKIMLQGKGR